MRELLGPSADPDPDSALDLHAFYATDWLEPGGLRVNFVSSVDGAVTAGGLSRGLQTPGDNKVFAVLRDLADVVVAGAGTISAEKYGPVKLSPARVTARTEHGLPPQLPVAVISRALNLDPASELFTPASERPRAIVLTCAAGGTPELRRRLSQGAEIIDCGDSEVDLTLARAALTERGHTRILCEGGPRLFADLAAAGVVDELCLSLSPLLAGPGSGRITAGTAWPGSDGLALTLRGLLEEDGALFLRYRSQVVPAGAGRAGNPPRGRLMGD
ncbi:riboflavin biosynthesis pyrimidine reductase [Jatrophihabitans sp. GAS493]|uniref:pyrimidine reductase family protein n=1 Tax=Jatrophihabitans sp. GAS493 TaxID=1907575 RepID=UPI000BB7BD40|nr:pyrimidine reductase family protein [Jatrophihabitans sp. GAS493]SOD74050.1 riboflavin biosynthesis pyrimidine reductase [Jatrophihabitans sp. GAS493]